MRRLPLTILFWGLTLIVFGQSSAAPTKDFFYGTWTDSTKEGITLTKEKKLILIKDTSKKQGLDSVKPKEFAWTYNLSLEKKPLTIEFNCEECDGTSMPKKMFGQIELINSRQIYLIIMDPSGKAKDRLLLTKN